MISPDLYAHILELTLGDRRASRAWVHPDVKNNVILCFSFYTYVVVETGAATLDQTGKPRVEDGSTPPPRNIPRGRNKPLSCLSFCILGCSLFQQLRLRPDIVPVCSDIGRKLVLPHLLTTFWNQIPNIQITSFRVTEIPRKQFSCFLYLIVCFRNVCDMKRD